MPALNKPVVLAFHLPQFHPIPENDLWWGKGFTEWTNVTRGIPLFRGHYQPHLPADLGFYDLRLPEARELQAELANEAGIGGFVYYHYWFSGRRLLERPVDDLLRSKSPDFPFCLCWANEPWSRNWDGNSRQILMPQSYSPEDDCRHIEWLLDAFADPRYLKIDGRPLFLVYRPSSLPDAAATAERWRNAAAKRGFPGLYLCGVQSFVSDIVDPSTIGFDAAVEFKPNCADHGEPITSPDPLEIGYRLHRVWKYDTMVERGLSKPLPDYPFFPGVCPSWDNTVRRREGAAIFHDATPDKYGAWLKEVMIREISRAQKPSLIFVNAWNEWAEGNHLEPCQKWGKGYIRATRAAIEASSKAYAAFDAVLQAKVSNPMPNDAMSNVDELLYDPSRLVLEASGWCLDRDTRKPLDAIFVGQIDEKGRVEYLAPVQHTRVARPDVASLHGSSSMLAGWRLQARGELAARITASGRLMGFVAQKNVWLDLAKLGGADDPGQH